MRTKKFLAMAIALGLAVGMTAMPTLAAEKKTLVFGDTTFNAENEEADINPQNTYAGWACIRYGVGETLFRYSDTMEIEPWIAKEYENIDELTWKITLNDGVVFSNGRACDGEAVKESLEALVANHERAAGDLCIDTIEADGNTVTIKTTEPKPALINYLSDPYGCIIDMQAGISDDGIVIGTGPYVATELVTDDHVNLVKNENYWNGDVNVDEITVRTISDGDTLAMALQAGEINAAYGMAYASYPLFENDDFTFTSTATSRAFYAWMNFESPVTSDPAVRKAIAMGIDKDSFVSVLLNGYGYPAVGVFPDTFSFGGQNLTTESYDPDGAKKVLEEAGWVDSDGDGIREKDGQKLEIRWLTYPSRQELPLLAESAQATLKEIGMDVSVEIPAQTDWAGQMAFLIGWGSPFDADDHTYKVFGTDKGANYSSYSNEDVDKYLTEARQSDDPEVRKEAYANFQKALAEDPAYAMICYIDANYVADSNIKGINPDTIMGHHGVGIFWNVADWTIE